MRTDLIFLIVLAIVIAGAGCARPEANATKSTRPAPAGVATSAPEVPTTFAGLELITPEPVYVNMELAMFCRGVSQNDIDSARKQFGPHANARINIYMNDPAAGAFRAAKGRYPVGAVIVKEKKSGGYFV